MKPSVLLVVVVLSLVGIASAASLFVKGDAAASGNAPKHSVEIKWGEGS